MKSFIHKFCLFVLISVSLMYAHEHYVYVHGLYHDKVYGAEVWKAIQLSKQKVGRRIKRLILGDSVANQMYPTGWCSDSTLSLATNQAISMAGQYFLFKNFLLANGECTPDEVVIVYRPFSLQNDLDCFAYQYFLKPFYTDEYLPYMNEYLLDKIHQIPWYYTSRWPFIRSTNYAFEYKLVENDSEWLSPISAMYLDSICGLAFSYQMNVRLVCAPLEQSLAPTIENLWKDSNGCCNTMHNPILNDYRQTLQFLPDSFFMDHVHFKSEYVSSEMIGVLDKSK